MESRHRRRNAGVDGGASSNASHSFDLVPMPPSPGVVIRDAVLSLLRVKPSLLLQKSLYWSLRYAKGQFIVRLIALQEWRTATSIPKLGNRLS